MELVKVRSSKGGREEGKSIRTLRGTTTVSLSEGRMSAQCIEGVRCVKKTKWNPVNLLFISVENNNEITCNPQSK
jgi:hypothetical protein